MVFTKKRKPLPFTSLGITSMLIEIIDNYAIASRIGEVVVLILFQPTRKTGTVKSSWKNY